jgi:hypothetical protein
MNNPSQKVPHQEAGSREGSDRPDPWVLDLGLAVESGGRPWLRTLAGAPLMLGAVFLVRILTDVEPSGAERDPDPVAVVDRVTGLVTVLSFVFAGIFLVAGVGYWFVCRYAYRVWRSLPEEEREALRRERIEALRKAIVALGGDDPDALPIRPEDLEGLSDRHRHLLEDLRARSERATSSICAGARARTDDLVMAGLLHRALSKDTIVRPPHAATSATDPRVLALGELDQELQAEAAAIGESLESGRCNCGQDTHDRLIQAGDRAHALLHGLTLDDQPDPANGAPLTRPRWVARAIWAGVAITIAALPIGLLTPIPSVVISALGISVTGVGYVAATRHTKAAPLDRLRFGLIFVAWIGLVIAAAATLLA